MQLEMDFEPGLTQRYPELIDLVAAIVYANRLGLGDIAAALDMAPSQLSRMLNRNGDDKRHFPVNALPALIKVTGDLRPVYWLVERFIEPEGVRKQRAVDEMAALLPRIHDLLGQMK